MTPVTRHDLENLARRQHWIVTSAQLGWSEEAVRHALRAGRLYRVHRGVYAVGRPDLTREARWMAAVLACGDGALLAGRAAAALWGLTERGGHRPEVLVGAQSGRRSRRAFDVRRTSTLQPADGTRRAGIPVTTVARTLLDLAGIVDRRALKSAVRQAERLHRIDLPALRARAAERAAHHARLYALLDAIVAAPGTQSELEARFLELCALGRLPAPQRQVQIGDYRVDFLWPDARLIVETDGRRTHDTGTAFVQDRVRDRWLRAAGYEVMRFAWAEVVRRPAAVAREVRAAMRRLS